MKTILSIFCSLCFFACHPVDAQNGSLTANEFAKKIATLHPQVLDVRTAVEFQSGHLKNALQADWLDKGQFADRTQYLDKNRPVLVYCASGVRSAAAAKWLKEKGFTEVQNMQGGLVSWKSAGQAMESVNEKPQLTPEQYDVQSKSGNNVLVEFGAEWCPPCKAMEPVLARLKMEMPGKFKLVKVDGGNDIVVMKQQKVEALPVFILYRNGKEVWRKQGVVAFDEMKSVISN